MGTLVKSFCVTWVYMGEFQE